jgi:thioredoxin reductase (NADPH)
MTTSAKSSPGAATVAMAVAYDAIIVGAGPAGLTAATYLARFRRRVLVLDGGRSRANWIPESHNTPGFPQGVGGPELLQRLRAQATTFGAERRETSAQHMTWANQSFTIETTEGPVAAPCVLLATGVVDKLPPLDGIEAAIRDSRVRMCPICDGYEAIDRRIAVLGEGDLLEREGAFLSTYSRDVTLLRLAGGPGAAETLAPGLKRLEIELKDLQLIPRGLRVVREGPAQVFDHLYLAMGCESRSSLATACGAGLDKIGNLIVDQHQETSTAGLFAAGDVVRGLNQIAVASGEAAIAATAIHNRLRGAA